MKLNPLTDKTQPFTLVEFIDSKKEKHVFHSEVNSLTGDRLTAFDNEAPTINNSINDIKKIISNIEKRATIVNYKWFKI